MSDVVLNNKIREDGYVLAELLWDAESLIELSYLCRTFDSVIERKREQLEVIEAVRGRGVL